MSILLDQDTAIIIQGITGKQASYHARKMLDFPCRVVGGVTPGRGGNEIHGLPVYDSVGEAVTAGRVDATMIMVPPKAVKDAAFDAVDNGIKLLVIITEHVPLHDTLKIKAYASRKGSRVIGPNTIGLISPGKAKIGVMPEFLYSRGPVGIISRSGTLTHEMASNLTEAGVGQSTCIGIGGDPVVGSSFVDLIKLFEQDEETKAIVMIGEIGGVMEEAAAGFLKNHRLSKPVYAFIAGRTAPEGEKMGHAGAIVQNGTGMAKHKISCLRSAGVTVFDTLEEAKQVLAAAYK